jgi:hypothetical protein
LPPLLLWGVLIAAALVAGFYAVHGAWRAWGMWRIRSAGPRPLRAATHVLWRDPGDVAALDLWGGPGGREGRPEPPFEFLEEHFGGSQPCLSVHDRRGRRWRVKWGEEVQSETFAVRIAWACGYFAEVTHYVAEGEIRSVKNLQRAATCVDEQCRFTAARFELDDPAVKKLFEEHSWSWDDNPFVGSRELQGLKILSMLLSNWDTKDRRDVARGSNTAIFEHATRTGREARYLITDWGGSMGSWGTPITRARWDPAGFEAQTPQFVTGVEGELVKFGYTGQRTEDVALGITTSDTAWLLRYLGRLTDAQVTSALEASGATSEERDIFRRALRDRINQLQRAVSRSPRS